MEYDRYTSFRENGGIVNVPYIPIRKKQTDRYHKYEVNKSRLDNISYQYYNDPNFGWLILLANPEYGSIEHFIPNNAILRIPYPLEETINTYQSDIEKYKRLYE